MTCLTVAGTARPVSFSRPIRRQSQRIFASLRICFFTLCKLYIGLTREGVNEKIEKSTFGISQKSLQEMDLRRDQLFFLTLAALHATSDILSGYQTP